MRMVSLPIIASQSSHEQRSRSRSFSLVALDIGGANIKVAHSSGQALAIPFEVWKRPDELGRAIAAAAAALPHADRAVVTMTAELCDCYPTKAVGVGAVLDAAVEGLAGPRDRRSGDATASFIRWPRFARIRNWPRRRTGWRSRRSLPDWFPRSRGILIDIGTTTADLIPLDSGQVRRGGAPIRNGSRPASLFTRAFGEHPSVRWRPSCRCGEFPPDWPPRSSRRRLMSTWSWVISSPSPTTARRPTAGLRPLRQRGTAWPGWSAPTATASPLWTQSSSLRPPMNA